MLVAYFSLEGNTKCIADSMAAALNADIEVIEPRTPIKAGKFMDHYWGNNKEHPIEEVEIKSPKNNPSDYDLIIVGTPVWAWAPAPPVYTYLKRNPVKGKKIALFSCSEGEPGKTFEKMCGLLKGNTIVSQREFINPRKDMDGTCSLKAQAWARSLMKQAG